MTQMVKSLPAMQKTWVRSLDQEDLLEKGMAAHPSIIIVESFFFLSFKTKQWKYTWHTLLKYR